MSVLKITSDNFDDEVMKSEKPILIDFYADWCGPCKMLSPVVDQIAEEISNEFKVGKINVDEEPELASNYGVMSIPTLIFFKNGEVKNTLVGLRGKEEIVKNLNDLK